MPATNLDPVPDTPADPLAAVMRSVGDLVARRYGGCEWASVVVHLGDGKPDLCIPIIPQAVSAPSSAN